MKNFVVAKFGGTSVADYYSMNRSADTLTNDPSTCLVVLSASAGVTNLLVNLSKGLEENERFIKLDALRKIQFNIIKYMQNPNVIRKKIESLLENIAVLSESAFFSSSSILTDELVSHGELMSTLLFVEILRERNIQAQWFDIRKVMHTNDQFGSAEPDIGMLAKLSAQKLVPCLENGIVITQGFIGSEAKGRTTTLGRGGSDYTATLLGEALNATRVDIWTDVTGIYTTDPRVVPVAKRINEIAFEEATEMAIFGAKVLHPDTLLPAVRSGIPVFIGSSKDPKAGGTLVHNKITNSSSFFALTLRHQQTLLTLHNLNIRYSQFQFFLEEVMNVLSRYNISVRLITTSKTSIALILDITSSYLFIDNKTLTKVLVTEFSFFSSLEIKEDLALIALIGNHIFNDYSAGEKVIRILESFNIRIIYYGTSSCNLFFLVPNSKAEKIIRRLYSNLFQ